MQKIYIDNSASVQSEFLGFNSVLQGFMFIDDAYGRAYTDEQIAAELKRIENSRVKMLRTYYDQGFAAVYGPDGFVKKDLDGNICWDYDSDIMQGFYKWLNAMKKRGINVILNLSWGTHILGEKTIFNQNNPFYGMSVDEVTEAYSQWVTESIRQIIVERGFDNVKYGTVFTEPYVRISITGKRLEGTSDEITGNTLSQTDWYADYAVPALDSALKSAGLRDKILLVGPNIALRDDVSGSPYTKTLEERVSWWIGKLNSHIDIYSFHWYPPAYPDNDFPNNDMCNESTYDTQSEFLSRIVPLIAKTGKQFWFDEFNYMPTDTGAFPSENAKKGWSGTQLAQIFIANMNSGLQNSLVWALNDVQWPLRNGDGREFLKGVHMTGMFPTQRVSSVPYKQFYAYTMLANAFNCDGSVAVWQCTDSGNVHAAAAKRSDGKTAIAVVNSSVNTANFELFFAKTVSNSGVTFERQLFDPETVIPSDAYDILPCDRILTGITSSISDTLPAGAVAVYIQK